MMCQPRLHSQDGTPHYMHGTCPSRRTPLTLCERPRLSAGVTNNWISADRGGIRVPELRARARSQSAGPSGLMRVGAHLRANLGQLAAILAQCGANLVPAWCQFFEVAWRQSAPPSWVQLGAILGNLAEIFNDPRLAKIAYLTHCAYLTHFFDSTRPC